MSDLFEALRFLRPGPAAALLAVLAGVAACGGEEKGAPPAKQAATAKDAKKPAGQDAKRGKDKVETLQFYLKIEDVVPEAERATIRHSFRDRDFVPDPTGSENRDPFRSFVINQPGLVPDLGAAGEQTESCSLRQLVATKYSLRDLRLVGIVGRDTRRFALFQDTADLGHVIHRGDCVGKEKARVKDIGAGFVTLELATDLVPGQQARSEERSIPLYPEELPIGEPAADETAPPPNAPAPSLPPPSLPPPSLPKAEQP